jgi:hypothetical protein
MLLKPTAGHLVITAALLLTAYCGYVQSEAFTEDPSQPALPLAHLFEPIPHLWELWVLLLAPLALTLRLLGVEQLFNAGPTRFFWTVQALYFFFLPCATVFFWNKLGRRNAALCWEKRQVPITIAKIDETTFKVTASDRTTTTQLVTVAPEYWQKLDRRQRVGREAR